MKRLFITPNWKMMRVWHDGGQSFVHLPMVMLARRNGESVMVGYRHEGETLIVDGIFDEAVVLPGTLRRK